VIYYSGVYTSNQIKFSNFIDSNNDNNDNNDLPFSLKPKDTNNLFTQSNSIDNNENLICNELNSNQTFDINTINDYQKLEFKPQYKTYWNYSFEKKYFEIKEKWKQLPLKVNIR